MQVSEGRPAILNLPALRTRIKSAPPCSDACAVSPLPTAAPKRRPFVDLSRAKTGEEFEEFKGWWSNGVKELWSYGVME
jgi:hypothetical protein